MKKETYVSLLLVGFLLGCKAVFVERPHIAAIQVVNGAGQGISGVELDSVYPVSWETVKAVTAADGIARMTFPVYSTGQKRIQVSMRSSGIRVGEVIIEFGAGRTTFFGMAELGYYTSLDSDGGVLRKRKLSNVLPGTGKESGEADRSH